MRVPLDTNLLTRLANPAQQPAHALAESSVELILQQGHVPCLFPQAIYEFWTVATRPIDSNGLGMKTDDVRREVDSVLSLFPLLQDERAIFPRWLDLATTHGVQGKASHDARIVAAMLRHGLSHLLTFNVSDFARYTEITVMSPEALVSRAVSLPAVDDG